MALRLQHFQVGPKEDTADKKPTAFVDEVLLKVKAVRESTEADRNLEYYGYAVGQMLKKEVDHLYEQFKEKLQGASEPDARHSLLREYKSAVVRLNGSSLPDALQEGLPENTVKFLALTWANAVDRMEAEVAAKLQPQGKTTVTRESLLLKKPECAHQLVNLINHLAKEVTRQEKAEADALEDFSYASASLHARQSMRRQYQLAAVPVMSHLLDAALDDLDSDGSLLLAAATDDHHGKYGTSLPSQSRREKLRQRVELLQKQEQTLGVSHPHVGVRMTEKGVVLRHTHQPMIDLFNKAGSGVLQKTDNVTEDDNYTIQPLERNPHGIFNVFFEDLPAGGRGVLKTSKATGEMTLSVSGQVDCQPPLVFQSRDGKHWTTLLNGVTWALDPSILHDNPSLKVPFGSTDHKQWDWIPLRNSNGETSILMLKKSANPISCLMYEMGSNGRLIAMPLQGGRASDEYVDAMVLEQAAYLTDDCPMCEAGQVSEATHSLKQLDRPWLKADSLTPQKLRQLEHLRMELEKTAGDRTQQPPFSTEPLDHRTMLRLPVVANIDVKKSDRDKSGAKVETCKPVCLDRFEVTAGFDTMSRKFVDRRQQSLVDPAQMQFMMDESDEFAKKAFPAMPVFSGCALQPLITGTTLVQVGKNRAGVQQALSKVLENTHKQCALARELKESPRAGIGSGYSIHTGSGGCAQPLRQGTAGSCLHSF